VFKVADTVVGGLGGFSPNPPINFNEMKITQKQNECTVLD
jgi:hypothetical protein